MLAGLIRAALVVTEAQLWLAGESPAAAWLDDCPGGRLEITAVRATADGLAWLAEHAAGRTVDLSLAELDYPGRTTTPTWATALDESELWAATIPADESPEMATAREWLERPYVTVRQAGLVPRRDRNGLPRTPWLHYGDDPVPFVWPGPATLSRLRLGGWERRGRG